MLLASALKPPTAALPTLVDLTSHIDYLYENYRLYGTAQYCDGEVAFLLVPF